MAEEFRIQHLAATLSKSLKTTLKGDQMSREFLENKTKFVTAQVNTHNANRKIAESSPTPKEFLAIYDELKARNCRILNGLVYILERVTTDDQLKKMIEAQALYLGSAKQTRHGRPLDAASYQAPKEEIKTILSNKTNLITSTTTTTTVDSVEAFQSMLNKSIDTGKRKMNSGKRSRIESNSGDDLNSNKNAKFEILNQGGAGDTMITLSRDTILDVNMQELNTRFNKTNAPFALRQPDWWNNDIAIGSSKTLQGKLASLPESNQEYLIVEDILSLLHGGEATHFSSEIGGNKTNIMLAFPNYKIDEHCDQSLKSLTRDPLKLVSCLNVIRRFVHIRAEFHYGYLSHALSAELSNYVHELCCALINFERTQKTQAYKRSLHLLATFVRPILTQATLISDLCLQLMRSNARGANLLSILHERAINAAGDEAGQRMLYQLTRETARPYMVMLERWIRDGELRDHHNEFMINAREELGKEKLQNVYNDSYWEQHYSIVRERIPRFLEPFAEKILNTGKYLNVIRECNQKEQQGQVLRKNETNVEYVMGPNCVRLFEAPIEKCYQHAAKVLVDLLMNEHNLVARLKSVKRFFLLDQGDFLNQFIDLADDELKMPVSELQSSRLEALLEISIRTSAADKDPYKDDLKVVLSDKDLITQLMSVILIESSEEETLRRVDPQDHGLSGLEALSFDYVVKWPLSLIISRKKIVHYQLLFRFLFYTKHIERIINNAWRQSNQLMKQYGCHLMYNRAAILRGKMLNFVLNLQTYVTNEVIEPHWHTLMTTLKTVQNIDQVLNAHDQFLETCLRECHLTNKAIFKMVHKIMAQVTIYVNYVNQIHRQIESRSAGSLTGEMRHEYLRGIFSATFDKQISEMDRTFDVLMLRLVDQLRDESKHQKSDAVSNLVVKLDFNHYFTKVASFKR